jgi:hypothetical protein
LRGYAAYLSQAVPKGRQMGILLLLLLIFIVSPVILLWAVVASAKRRKAKDTLPLQMPFDKDTMIITDDTLSVSLKKTVVNLKENYNRCKLLLVLSMSAICISLFDFRLSLGGFILLFCLGFLILFTCYRTYRIRRRLCLYDGIGIPLLTLDKNGLTCPLIALSWASQDLLKIEKTALAVQWHNITSWTTTPNRRLYIVQLSNSVIISSKQLGFVVAGVFSIIENEQIMKFARRYLSTRLHAEYLDQG